MYGREIYPMVNRHYIFAIVSFLLIPAVFLLNGMIFRLIDPEIARHTQNYVLVYRLLDLVRNASILIAFLINIVLWILTCFFLLKSKQQSYWWMLLAVLGPFGFITMTILRDKNEENRDLYRRFVRRLMVYFRVPYELGIAFIVWNLAYELMVVKRNLVVQYKAAATGVSVAQIIDQQNASSGMWAFSEGLEVLFVVVLMYLIWPLCFNLVGQLVRLLWPNHQENVC
jgi:hypothetical protein